MKMRHRRQPRRDEKAAAIRRWHELRRTAQDRRNRQMRRQLDLIVIRDQFLNACADDLMSSG